MMKILKNNSGVSHQVGFMLTLSLTTVIIAVTIITTNALIDNKARDAAEIYAENIANKVASAIINVCVLKEQYPNADYSTVLDIPLKLVDRFSYYIEIDKEAVYVKSYDGSIVEKSTIYNVTDKQALGISGGIIDGSGGAINISCDSYNYIYRFDFGTNTSTGSTGYTRVTNLSNNGLWHNSSYRYRNPITIKNPVGKTLTDYQILIQLDDTNFDYSLANSNGSDLNFTDKDGRTLNYWIERWYPRDTHTSRIWVNVSSINSTEDYIYMYYGNDSASPMSNGEATFDFFDDFTVSDNPDSNKWCEYEVQSDDVYVEDGLLVIKNGSAVNSTTKVGSTPCVIETKAKTVGDNREASMFARSSESGGAPYNNAYLFASGCFTGVDKNLSILKDGSVVQSLGIPVNQEWNRLAYIINDTAGYADTLVCRYFYENFTVDGPLVDTSAPAAYRGDKHFGLCTTEGETTAYYDWIYVRKFEADVSGDVTSTEESIPVAYLCGTDSLDYGWEDTALVKSVERDVRGDSYDFICNTGDDSATFTISNFISQRPDLNDEDLCSLVFTVGDPDRNIQNMKISVTGVSPRYVNCDHSYKKIRIDINAVDDLQITFEDTDTASEDKYWAVSDMTIQTGKRVIKISGGK